MTLYSVFFVDQKNKRKMFDKDCFPPTPDKEVAERKATTLKNIMQVVNPNDPRTRIEVQAV